MIAGTTNTCKSPLLISRLNFLFISNAHPFAVRLRSNAIPSERVISVMSYISKINFPNRVGNYRNNTIPINRYCILSKCLRYFLLSSVLSTESVCVSCYDAAAETHACITQSPGYACRSGNCPSQCPHPRRG